MAQPDNARLEEAVASVLESEGVFLDRLKLRSAGRRTLVQITVDAEHSIGLDDIAALSRKIDAAIDADNLLGDAPYTLEVSSRGTDQPLQLPRHFAANVGRLVAVEIDGKPGNRRIESVDGDQVNFATGESVRVTEVAGAKLVLEFNRKDVQLVDIAGEDEE